MDLTIEEKQAIQWAIAMIRPRDDKHSETLPGKMANILQGIIDKTNGEKHEPS